MHPFDDETPRPPRLPSPFAVPPHPLAKRAAEALQRWLDGKGAMDEGKMFGVLVVADRQGARGVLHAFSGMWQGRWVVEGFVPPLFDEAQYQAIWSQGEFLLGHASAIVDAHTQVLQDCQRELASFEAMAREQIEHLEQTHRRRKAARDRKRNTQHADDEALNAESQRDGSQRKRLRRSLREQRERYAERVDEAQQRVDEATRKRSELSQSLLPPMQATYRVLDAGGGEHRLADIFAPDPAPGGAGDCAAPKLLGAAYRHGLTPLAMAEFWWGPPPPSGDRQHGAYYPACRRKCGPLLPVMLRGLDVDPAPTFSTMVDDPDEPRTIFEDNWLVVVDKPSGMLSVPGRRPSQADSVQTRLQQRLPAASDLRVAHRLDLDTSGVMVATKTQAAYVALQQQFARHTIDKRYLAWVEGEVGSPSGRIELPLRVDIDDRPRQIHDPTGGKAAITLYDVRAKARGQTLVALTPLTGRTHQLRVHAAHPQGLNAPIVGDRLYGTAGPRLYLHATTLSIDHPHTHERMTFESPLPPGWPCSSN